MELENMMCSLDEIGLIPAKISKVKSRSDVNPFIDGKLPVFVAPMTCILNQSNFSIFSESKFIPILPVTNPMKRFTETLPGLNLPEDEWFGVTLDEFKYLFIDKNAPDDRKYKILIDCANGHMERIFDYVPEAKKNYSQLIVMAGNIANPYTYLEYCNHGIDYVRVGIGGGSGCTTSTQTGMHASLPFLINTIIQLREWYFPDNKQTENGFVKTKIVADGGINSIKKAIIALALGADYVMMGQAFCQCEEAATDTYYKGKDEQYHLYYGQSSEHGQMDRFGYVKSNPEGTSKWVRVENTLDSFGYYFEASLRSSMSYANATCLSEFHPEYRIMSQHEFESFNK